MFIRCFVLQYVLRQSQGLKDTKMVGEIGHMIHEHIMETRSESDTMSQQEHERRSQQKTRENKKGCLLVLMILENKRRV